MPVSPLGFQAALDELARSFNTSQQETLEGLSAKCPHCGSCGTFRQTNFVNTSGSIQKLGLEKHRDRAVIQACCPNRDCRGVVIVSSAYYVTAEDSSKNQLALKLLWPRPIRPSKAPFSLDEKIRKDYDEARAVLHDSPTASAVLCRRCLQHVIREKLNIRKDNLYQEIQEAAESPELSKETRETLDHIRHIGNWGAHPKTDLHSGLVLIEVDHVDAEFCLDTLEVLFHDLYDAPERRSQRMARLNHKKQHGTPPDPSVQPAEDAVSDERTATSSM